MKHIRFKTTNQSNFYRDMMCSGLAWLDEEMDIRLTPELGMVYLGRMIQTPGKYDEDGTEIEGPIYYDGEYADVLLESKPDMKNCRHTELIEPFGGHEFAQPEPEPTPMTEEELAADMASNPDKYLDDTEDVITRKLLETIRDLQAVEAVKK